VTADGFTHLGDQSVYRGYIWEVVVGSFRDPVGNEFTRDIVRSPGAVAVVPLLRDEDGSLSVVLLRQYRAAFAREIVELPSHPWFVATQFHPEFKSTPRDGHPLFTGFVRAARKARESKASS